MYTHYAFTSTNANTEYIIRKRRKYSIFIKSFNRKKKYNTIKFYSEIK